MSSILSQAIYLSLVVQAVVGVLDIYGILLKVPPREEILISLLKIETLVQVVQFVMYLYLFQRINVATMATDRYKDWFITTPLMLFTTLLYFEYNNKPDQVITLTNFVATNQKELSLVIVSNFVMLLFGLLGEYGTLSILTATIGGFAAYAFTFWFIYNRYVKGSEKNKGLFQFFSGVWVLYGVAYWLPVIEKNLAYTGLDIVAKNFFGVYLFWLVYQARIKNPATSK